MNQVVIEAEAFEMLKARVRKLTERVAEYEKIVKPPYRK